MNDTDVRSSRDAASEQEARNPRPEHVRQATRSGWLAALVAAPLFAIFFITPAMLVISSMGGGTFIGGYGATTKPPDAWWAPIAQAAVWLLAIWLVIKIARDTYRWTLRRLQRDDQPPRK
jgi:membrane protein implicated in regulation of membrane protease activity